jgi:iron complex transport system substrate-binding protein
MQNKRLKPFLGLLWITLAGSLLLVACGDNTPTPAGPAATIAATTASTAITTAGTPAISTGERIIKHVMGETKVPLNPKRVVVLDSGELDTAITLGIQPVGAASAGSDKFLSYLEDKTQGITNIGSVSQPNLEKVASLQPDLILGNKFRHEALYGKLSEIAPTVFAENVGPTWKENFRIQSEALGKAKEGADIMAAYDKRMSEFKQKMGDNLTKSKVSVVRVFNDRFRIYTNNSFIGIILKDAGLPRPAAQDTTDKFLEYNSLEQVNNMDGDVIFLTRYGKSEEKYKELTANPLWKQLNGVKQNKVFEVNDDIWVVALGMAGANLVIDDLYKYLLG